MTVILGINGFSYVGHDAAAALLVDKHLVAAVEEERLVRVKRAYNRPPAMAIREVLDIVGLCLEDVDVVTFPWLPSALGMAAHDVEQEIRGWLTADASQLKSTLRICFIEHHLAHAWSGLAFVPDGIRSQRAGVLVLDGSGESTSGACYVYDGKVDSKLTCRWWLPQASSLGVYYEAATQYLGFRWGDEGKTMGLAAYGRNLNITVPLLPDQRFEGPLPTQPDLKDSPRNVHAEIRNTLIEAFRALHGDDLSFNQRADVALASQYFVMQRILDYVTELLDDIDILILCGGVALNCAINEQVALLCHTKGVKLVIPPPASDTGVALGSVLAGTDDPASVDPLDDPFLGRMYTADMIARELHREGVSVKEVGTQELALKILEQSIVCGWFEGRSEIGPRALGKRSIIARPNSTAIRDRINVLKGRESWRPLAPSLTADEFERSFAGSMPSPYMLINASISSNARSRLAGVVHVDDTSRPQVVTFPGAYHELLKELGKLSGTEAAICTSFNPAGEPIVYTPVEALQSARAMKLDLLAGDGWCVHL